MRTRKELTKEAARRANVDPSLWLDAFYGEPGLAAAVEGCTDEKLLAQREEQLIATLVSCMQLLDQFPKEEQFHILQEIIAPLDAQLATLN